MTKHPKRARDLKQGTKRMVDIATGVVDRADRIILSQRDTRRVLKLLGNPPRPPKALLAAAWRRARP